MPLRIINRQTVERCLHMEDCIDLMAEVQKAISEKEIRLPLRHFENLEADSNSFGIMPGEIPALGIFGAKLISLFPANPRNGKPAIQGGILLFDAKTGTPSALVDAASVTAIRTAAASAVATDSLARKDAQTLTILGTGVQAVSHLSAMMAVRPLTTIRVWGRSFEKAQALAEAESRRTGLRVEATSNVKTAVEDADIVCTVTGSETPILEGKTVRPGCHINCVGAHAPYSREVDSNTIRKARVYVEVKEFALQEAGELLIPLTAGEITADHIIGEIGEVLTDKVCGRLSPTDITLYKSLGNTAQDIAAASHVVKQAESRGLGEVVEL